MNHKKIIKQKFKVVADYAWAWGWQADYYEDGTHFYCNCNEFITDRDGNYLEKIDKSLIEELDVWQVNFERNSYENPNFDWENFNKKGEELTEKLKKQIGHLFDEIVYEPPFEYYEYLKKIK